MLQPDYALRKMHDCINRPGHHEAHSPDLDSAFKWATVFMAMMNGRLLLPECHCPACFSYVLNMSHQCPHCYAELEFRT